MKTNCFSNEIQSVSGKFNHAAGAFKSLLVLLCALTPAFLGQAAPNVYWDAAAGGNPSDGSGNWTTNLVDPAGLASNPVWWNGTADQNWADGSNAVIGASVPGTYFITNNVSGGTQLNPNSIIFTNVGNYDIVLDTNPADLGQISFNPGGGGGGNFSPAIFVGTNIQAVINVPWVARSGDIYVASNASLTFSANTAGSFGGGLSLKGAGPTVSVINCTNGMLGCNFADPSLPTSYNQIRSTSETGGVLWNITGDAIVNMSDRFDISRGGDNGAGAGASSVINVGGVGEWAGVAGVQAQLNGNTQNAPSSGASVSTDPSQNIQISRGGGPAVVNLYDGGLISTFTCPNAPNIGVNGKLKLAPDGNGPATFNMYGGILTLGGGPTQQPGVHSSLLTPITFFDSVTPSATASAIFNMSGGVAGVLGIQVGGSANFAATTTNQVNISGGTLYLDAPNIFSYATNTVVNLSGGTIAATADWSPACSLPMNLTNINGNITFQTADTNGTPWNISIASSLTGVGGLNKTGAGVLTLSGANNYSGSTVISDGTLAIPTASLPVNGAVTLEGASVAAGLPVNSVILSSVGQSWVINGDLTYDSGTPTADFNFGSFLPSATVAPIQVNGDVAFNVAPQISVEGSAIASGTYPLIQYTGTVSGTPPTVLVSLPSGAVSATIINDTANKSIDLQINSSINPSLTWGVGNGDWDFSTANWAQAGNPVDYADGDDVIFDDTASGVSPIAVTLNTTVAPGSIAANNPTKSYVVSGSGAIAGATAVSVSGAAGLTLAGANTYTGGTTVTGTGRLNINNGGDGGADSAIGTGPLTLQLGAKLDNTSGSPITLMTSVPEVWANDFAYLGSGNFDTGPGSITMGNGIALTVNSNVFEVDGQITDNGAGYSLTKVGNGALTLATANNFSGGMTLGAGTLNINADGAVGTGTFTLGSGATVDNTSGNDGLQLTSYNTMKWAGNFTFNGTADLDFVGQPASVIDLSAMTLTVNSNTLTTESMISGGNTVMSKAGPGAWTIGGGSASGAFGININDGTVNLNMVSNGSLDFAVAAGVITVNTNGNLVMLNPNGLQLGETVGIVLSGGTVELNGDSGEIFQSITFNSGVLRNSSGAAEFTLSQGISLTGTNCDFDLTNNAALTIDGIISNTGSLLETGNGILTLTSNSTYTGGTIIAGGTLALADPLAIGGGSISNSALIDVHSGATLDVTGRGDQTLTLNSGQTLAGKGNINGNLVASSGSIVSPGGALTIGTLTVAGNVTLNGNLLLDLNRTNTPNGSSLAASGTITYGGTLSVTNAGPALQVGDTFQLFPSAVTAFTGFNLATTDANGFAYTWENDVASNGSIKITSVATAVNPNPGTIQFSQSGNSLSLAWPTNAGWLLQVQTNSLAVGLNTNWVTLPDSSSMAGTNIIIDPASGAVFYRLIHP